MIINLKIIYKNSNNYIHLGAKLLENIKKKHLLILHIVTVTPLLIPDLISHKLKNNLRKI